MVMALERENRCEREREKKREIIIFGAMFCVIYTPIYTTQNLLALGVPSLIHLGLLGA